MNIADYAFLIEFGLVFGAIFGFCFWQLHSLNKYDREKAKSETKEEE